MPKTTYPIPGTHAETILDDVRGHDATTTHGIISRLKLNPSVVRKSLTVLVAKGRLIDRVDDKGIHHWSVKDTVL